MKKPHTFILLAIFIISLFSVEAKSNNSYSLWSPNGFLRLEIGCSPELRCILQNEKKQLISIRLGFKNAEQNIFPNQEWQIINIEKTSMDSTWTPVWGKRHKVENRFSEARYSFINTHNNKITVIFRLYNDGLAFRYLYPEKNTSSINGIKENTRFCFFKNHKSWFYNGANYNKGMQWTKKADGDFLPVMTIEIDKNNFIAIHEADLTDNEPLELQAQKNSNIFRTKSESFCMNPGYKSAWRVVFWGQTPGNIVDSHLLELLNEDPKTDFSWVRPGIGVWDWRINGAIGTDGFKYTMTYPSWVKMVDFAASNGFDYLILDANWYGPEHEESSNPTDISKASDVKKIINYAKKYGVGIWLYLNDVAGKKYPIEDILKEYATWGAKGIKYGFMTGTDKEKNQWTKHITSLCAKYKLLVDFHDLPIHPFGQMRTWPNALSREYCHAQLDAHKVFLPKTYLTMTFTNMIAGPIDMNNGMFDLRQGPTTRIDENTPVPSTIVSEAARTLITYSGITIIPDIPDYYNMHPELLGFITQEKMPWLESKTLKGEIEKYIVMMRETENYFLVAGANNEKRRKIIVPLDFLPDGTFEGTLITDTSDSHYLYNREKYNCRKISISRNNTLTIEMASGGGFCLSIKKN